MFKAEKIKFKGPDEKKSLPGSKDSRKALGAGKV